MDNIRPEDIALDLADCTMHCTKGKHCSTCHRSAQLNKKRKK